MFAVLRDSRLSVKLGVFVAVFVVLFGAFVFMVHRAIETVRVNGEMYHKIILGKDLIADVLPPPEYIIEAYLLSLQLSQERDPTRLSELVARGNRLRIEYENRHEFWKRTLPPDALGDMMTITSYRPAIEFFELRDNQFVPAIRSNETERSASALLQMQKLYEMHRLAIDEVVKMANARNAGFEAEADQVVRAQLRNLVVLGALILLIVLVLAGFASRVATRLSQRITVAAEVATRIAAGDLSVEVPTTDDVDETGKLLRAIGAMAHNLRALVTRVKQASIEMMSTATEFAAASRQQESTVQGFGASTTQIATATRQISTTAAELLLTVEGVSAVASQTSDLAEQGRSGLHNLDESMARLGRAAAAMSSRLAAIREEAAEITGVVTTISKVADQTNLLSINAAIEAEKAGEQGLGFLVLAREIRRLADQTAVATLDIEEMVKQMQSAVSAGVMEIDRFAEEVKSGVGSVERIGGRFGQIITQVKSLSERFDSVNHGMKSQNAGARQISDAMGNLMDGARSTSNSLREFNAATENLRDAIGSLKQQIAQFDLG